MDCFSPEKYYKLKSWKKFLRPTVADNVSEAFLPTKNWVPWSPPNEDFREEREVFYPEAAVKFEGDYHRCSHNCWLSNDVIANEMQLCTRTNQVIDDELKQVNFRKIFPDTYKKYKPFLRHYQEG